jgi:hypothetical protein
VDLVEAFVQAKNFLSDETLGLHHLAIEQGIQRAVIRIITAEVLIQ